MESLVLNARVHRQASEPYLRPQLWLAPPFLWKFTLLLYHRSMASCRNQADLAACEFPGREPPWTLSGAGLKTEAIPPSSTPAPSPPAWESRGPSPTVPLNSTSSPLLEGKVFVLGPSVRSLDLHAAVAHSSVTVQAGPLSRAQCSDLGDTKRRENHSPAPQIPSLSQGFLGFLLRKTSEEMF